MFVRIVDGKLELVTDFCSAEAIKEQFQKRHAEDIDECKASIENLTKQIEELKTIDTADEDKKAINKLQSARLEFDLYKAQKQLNLLSTNSTKHEDIYEIELKKLEII